MAVSQRAPQTTTERVAKLAPEVSGNPELVIVEQKVFSQNGEDGVLASIFAAIGVQNRESAGGGLRLFSDDQWLSVFVEDPAPVEALGASEASEGDAAVEADK